MEGVVAKRCLRSNRLDGYYYDIDRKKLNSLYTKGLLYSGRVKGENKKKDSYLFKLKLKLWIQSINAMCILILVIICNIMNVSKINENKHVRMLVKEYRKEYAFSVIKDKGAERLKLAYKGISFLIPDKLEHEGKEFLNKMKAIFFTKQEANKEENKVTIYSEEQENIPNADNEVTTNNGVGVSIEEKLEETQEQLIAESSISEEDEFVKVVRESGIKFILPTKGTVSSEFGDREVIFTDVDPFHTGIDIANKKGTEIVSSINGEVTKVANNKYNGNYIEISNGNISTKYAHLDSISVVKGANVSMGEMIGKMGDTGYATGPHLHFEIVVNGMKIDPRKILEI